MRTWQNAQTTQTVNCTLKRTYKSPFSKLSQAPPCHPAPQPQPEKGNHDKGAPPGSMATHSARCPPRPSLYPPARCPSAPETPNMSGKCPACAPHLSHAPRSRSPTAMQAQGIPGHPPGSPTPALNVPRTPRPSYPTDSHKANCMCNTNSCVCKFVQVCICVHRANSVCARHTNTVCFCLLRPHTVCGCVRFVCGERQLLCVSLFAPAALPPTLGYARARRCATLG